MKITEEMVDNPKIINLHVLFPTQIVEIYNTNATISKQITIKIIDLKDLLLCMMTNQKS